MKKNKQIKKQMSHSDKKSSAQKFTNSEIYGIDQGYTDGHLKKSNSNIESSLNHQILENPQKTFNNHEHDFPARQESFDQSSEWRPASQTLHASKYTMPTTPSLSPGPHSGKAPKGYFRSDARINEDVCEALMLNAEIDAREIEVNVKEGVVTFSGTVESRSVKRMVEEITESLYGVEDIKNELTLIHSDNINKRSK